MPLRVDFVSIGRDTKVHPDSRIARARHAPPAGYTATFEASAESVEGLPRCGGENLGPADEIVTIAAGTRAKVILLGSLSASRSREGDMFQARTVEPVLNDSTMVLPEGSVLQGRVVRRIPPRMLSRIFVTVLHRGEQFERGNRAHRSDHCRSGSGQTFSRDTRCRRNFAWRSAGPGVDGAESGCDRRNCEGY